MQLRKSIFRTPDKIPENPPTFRSEILEPAEGMSLPTMLLT
ncbi:Uncharacterized protein dnm_072000 [Desulfonema magnum]|uniref:Uncharacterized protein n=1 Tax=Desulfonema magnum TaxID=45655 RepID=A0A975BTV7_9BACT|nr:Uncharacterized protein dnm_071990 [Desulfonema magnum]QTA91135.1 Uncharacterized protein dnm_072000 [Desulfonema magnum]